MGITLSTFIAPIDIREEGQCSERQQNRESSPVFGRSANEIINEEYKTISIIDSQLMQNDLNQNKSETADLSWHGHCQFFADCTDCHRFKTEPDNADKTTQGLQINEKVESGSGNTASQTRHRSNNVVTVNTSESCQRIKPASQNIFITPG